MQVLEGELFRIGPLHDAIAKNENETTKTTENFSSRQGKGLKLSVGALCIAAFLQFVIGICSQVVRLSNFASVMSTHGGILSSDSGVPVLSLTMFVQSTMHFSNHTNIFPEVLAWITTEIRKHQGCLTCLRCML